MCNSLNIESPTSWLFKKKNFLFCLTIFLFFVYNNAIVDAINFLILKNVGYTYPTLFKDCLFTLFLLATLGFYWGKRKEYIPSNNITSLLLLYFLFYIYYRLYNKSWEFTSFQTFPRYKYLDVTAAIAALNSFIWVANWVNCDPGRIDKSKNQLFDDTPVERQTDDMLGYNKYAISLSTKIENSSFDKSFAIGINGYWGIGKTSFIYLLLNNLLKEDKIFVHFHPWDCKTSDAIILDFFDAFQESIRPYHSSLARRLLRYSGRLVKTYESSLTTSFHAVTSTINNVDSIDSLYRQINLDLKQINRKVIVIIDDLDRLDSAEVLEVLKLIRNTANFHNTFFIVAYDRNYIINALKTSDIHKPQHFLEKIFQIEITLPQFDKILFRKRLYELIKSKIDSAHHKSIEESILGTGITKPVYLDQWLSSMRDVTRIANSIVLNFTRLQGEVIFEDFLKLEVLRLNYPTVYELIFRRTEEVLETREKRDKRRYVLRKEESKGGKRKFEIENKLMNDCEEDGVNECEVEKVIGLLDSIFPDDNHWFSDRDFLSVVYPSSFSRYFNYELLKDDLSEVEFSIARRLDSTSFQRKIDEWVSKGLEFLLKERLEKISEFDDKADFEKIISSIFYLGKKETLKDKSYSKLVGYSAADLHSKLSRSAVSKYYHHANGQNEYRRFLFHLFLKHPPYEFEAAILGDWLMHFSSVEPFVLTQSDWQRLVLFYFARHVRTTNNIDSVFWYYYHCCKYMDWVERENSGTRDGYRKVLPKVKEIIEYFVLNKDLDGFLKNIVDYNNRADTGVDQYAPSSEFILKTWGSWGAFKEFLYSINRPSAYLSEFKTFFEEFEKINFSHFIPFAFQVIPVKKTI